ncbi:proline-rich protein 36-like [Eriocheir sinensis]|uniref:proline-rich protein 36-like n=1 Tax=Eriocheir sinensis TaxID=95602 RepID=UPI0021C7A7BE|nr:proline-rich protein 36-like [Eriocheir sinensis]
MGKQKARRKYAPPPAGTVATRSSPSPPPARGGVSRSRSPPSPPPARGAASRSRSPTSPPPARGAASRPLSPTASQHSSAVSGSDPGPAVPTPAATASVLGAGPPLTDSDSCPGSPADSDSRPDGPAASDSDSTGPPPADSNSSPGCSAAPPSASGRDVQHKRARCSSSSSAASSTEDLPPDEPADSSASRACKSRRVHDRMEDSESGSSLTSSSESEIVVDVLDGETAPSPTAPPINDPAGDDGWQTVGPKRQRRSLPADSALSAGASTSLPPRHPSRPQSPLPPPPRTMNAPAAAQPASLPKLLIPATVGFETTLDLAEALEQQLGERLSLKFLESGCVLITPADSAQHDTLLAVREVSGVPVQLRVAPGANTKGVLLAYPVAMPLKPLLRHPRVLEAVRCTTRDGPTRQVFVTVAGPLPGSLDLGSWGTFYTRPYSKEPLRCYNCQQFGHHRARCSRPPVCGICSASHDTERCLSKYKTGQTITSRCPNCQGEHHAWNRACANRRELVDKQRTVQQRWVITHRPAPLGTFRWGAQQPPASTAAPTPRLPQTAHQPSLIPPSPAPYEESFPPLTPHHLPPPPPAQPTAPQAPDASRQPRLPTTAAPTAAPPGCLLITREMMVGLLEGFGRIIATALKSDVEPRVFSDAAQQVVGNLFPETPAQQAAVPPVQAPSPDGPSSTPPTPTPRALKTPLPPPPAPVHASSSTLLPTPPAVATSQHYPLVALPPAPTSLNEGGLPPRPVMARYRHSRKLSV